MQAHVGFLAGVLQSSMALMRAFEMDVPADAPHPCAPGGHNIAAAWRWLAQMLNLPASRWTPYLVQAFTAVAGHELGRRCGAQMPKLVRLMASRDPAGFLERCRAAGEMDVGKTDNDVDRFAVVEQFLEAAVASGGGAIPAPGKGGQDARQLVMDVASNES